MSDLTVRLRSVVEQATPGPWGLQGRWLVSTHPAMHQRTLEHVDGSGWDHDGDLDYIATFDPALVDALLDVVEAAEQVSKNGLVIDDRVVERVIALLDGTLVRLREVAG